MLVAYGTKHGATAEIAEAIARALSAAGWEVDVQRARRVRSLERYRAVVLGSAVYTGRWRRDALRLLQRSGLGEREVWLFSSGPVGEDKGDPEQLERWTKPPRVCASGPRRSSRNSDDAKNAAPDEPALASAPDGLKREARSCGCPLTPEARGGAPSRGEGR